MLLRLQGALGQDDLIEEMILLPGSASTPSDQAKETTATNLIVGYNGSAKSQTALDLALGVAHQTRLATRGQVTVQVVYVVDINHSKYCPDSFFIPLSSHNSLRQLSGESLREPNLRSSTPTLTRQDACALVAASPLIASTDPCLTHLGFDSIDPLEQADRILWQARCLAEEWRGSLKAHLRFGEVCTELRDVAEAEAAALLFLGCHSVDHPVVQALDSTFPCPVLGIPSVITDTQPEPEAQSETVV